MNRLITFEGVDGCGKTTQFHLLSEALSALGVACVTTREPGGCPLGEKLRDILLYGEEMSPESEALLFAAARAQHVQRLIGPALANGQVVLCDRFFDSSMAFQAFGRGLCAAWVREVNAPALAQASPGRTYLLRMDAQEALVRRGGGPADRMERADDDFRRRVAAGFDKLAADEPDRFLVLDATRSIKELAQIIRADALKYLGRF